MAVPSAATSPLASHPVLAGLQGRDLLSSADLSPAETAALLLLAADLKAGRTRIDLGGRTLGLIFSKASTRTRVSFTVAMARLGGQPQQLDGLLRSEVRGGEEILPLQLRQGGIGA